MTPRERTDEAARDAAMREIDPRMEQVVADLALILERSPAAFDAVAYAARVFAEYAAVEQGKPR